MTSCCFSTSYSRGVGLWFVPRPFLRGASPERSPAMDLADELLELGVKNAALILAVERGLITELACTMEECFCPEGRTFFEDVGKLAGGRGKANKWAPSPDRWPIPGRDGGKYVPENVRLAHFQCNRLEGPQHGNSSPGGKARMAALSLEERQALSRLAGLAASRKMTPEQKSARGRAGHKNLTPEQEFARSSKGGKASMAALTAEERREKASHAGKAAIAKQGGGWQNGRAICARWLKQGKPCSCGTHLDASQ